MCAGSFLAVKNAMTLNFGALPLALMVEQPHVSTAMPNALRRCMLTILNTRDSWRKLSVAFALLFSIVSPLRAQSNPDWTEPFPPFRIAGNLYYVGSKDLAIYLVTTPQGHMLINSGLVTSVPLIRTSVEKLGFKFNDIKILLISHAHWDHDGGSAEIKTLTGATYMVMDADVAVV